MAIRLPGVVAAKQILRRSSLNKRAASTSSLEVPKGCFAVYIGESEKKRFVIPLSFLSQALFQDLLTLAEEEFSFNHPMAGLTIPCHEDLFIDITSRLDSI